MDVVGVNDKVLATRLFGKLTHTVKVNKQAQKDLIARRTVAQDAEQVALEGDRGYVAGMECKRHIRREGTARSRGKRAPYRRVVRFEQGGRGCGRVQRLREMRVTAGEAVVGGGYLREQRGKEAEQLLGVVSMDVHGGRVGRRGAGEDRGALDGGARWWRVVAAVAVGTRRCWMSV